MSRYCGEVNTAPILEAAARWRDVALLSDRSVFRDDKRLWTVEGLDALDRHFVRNLDEGDRNVWAKLKDQLAPTKPAVKQLAAEMIWLMYLCPSNIGVRHKRETIQQVWSWSGEPFPSPAPLLDDQILSGIGSGGPGFNQYQWKELAFVINFMRAWRGLGTDQQRALAGDGWRFAEWLKSVPDAQSRQMRHMLMFLLFPDDFERIFGKQDRRRIAQVFSGLDQQSINRLDPVQLDRTLREIRTKLEEEYGTAELDYYVPPLKHRWNSEGAAGVLDAITAKHVQQAIDELARTGIPEDAESTGYDLIRGGRRFPPKLVVSRAAKYATGEELDRGAFAGGEDSTAFRFLRRLGFEIEPKDAIPNLIRKFHDQAKAGEDLKVREYIGQYRGLIVKVSFGQGVFSRIPWIAFLAEGQQVSKGIYPVLLLFREQNVLLLCYGISEENTPNSSWGELRNVPSVQAWYRKRFDENPDRYGASFVRAAYELDKPIPIEDLGRDLDLLIDEYKRVISGNRPGPVTVESRVPTATQSLEQLPVRPDIAEAVKSFALALRNSYVNFGVRHDELVASFVASVVTKPLVILTGLSGSGKTQIAIRFGEWLGENRLYVSAVRPDWTGAESLFGYEDALKPALEGRAAWNVPAPLEFMLRALHDPAHPYLLVLDEMNLAHVERYFADVLSGMESGQNCIPNLRQGSDTFWRSDSQDSFLPFPRNLWIVGTVNVDETTYMFSPKVLDRANTFEFRVATEDLQFDSRRPRRAEVGDPALARGLLAIAKDDEWHQVNAATFGGPFSSKLKQLHGLLSRYGIEFGHRSFYEAVRFAAISEKAGLGGLELALDRVVMQKILPRLHGSRRKLELPILALLHFCRDLPETVAADQQLATVAPEKLSDTGAKLPLAHDKLSRMLRGLHANQFASFTD